MKKLCLILVIFSSLIAVAREIPTANQDDIDKINNILEKLQGSRKTEGEKMVYAALELIGSEEDDYYSVDSIGELRVNMQRYSPLMFINTVIALTKASEFPGKSDWHLFLKELEDVSCRRGENKGFPSIMYHTSDWIGDNISRGKIIELTENYNGVVARTKSLDEMTRKRNNYAALSDSNTFETVRMIEMGFRTHRIPALKKETIKKKEINDDLRNGDIIIFVPNRDGIDMYDIGIVAIENDAPHLIHLSPQTHKIVKEEDDIARYMALMTKYFQGYRILRLKD